MALSSRRARELALDTDTVQDHGPAHGSRVSKRIFQASLWDPRHMNVILRRARIRTAVADPLATYQEVIVVGLAATRVDLTAVRVAACSRNCWRHRGRAKPRSRSAPPPAKLVQSKKMSANQTHAAESCAYGIRQRRACRGGRPRRLLETHKRLVRELDSELEAAYRLACWGSAAARQ